jgi:hypothetical protein
MRARKKMWDATMAATVSAVALILQETVINRFPVNDVYCNLPLTLVIVWGAVFGSPLPSITPDELRLSSAGQIFARQAASGSVSGLLLGGLIASFYASVLPIFPVYLPIIGWIAGYFCLRNINQRNFLCIPLVLILTGLAESMMALQLMARLWLTNHDSLTVASTMTTVIIDHLIHIVPSEAMVNAIIAPFVYFPMRSWYDFSTAMQVIKEA